ncbi:MAG: hypothetical protein ACE5KZ_16745 [Candidatus Scalinduaceae bacterium]
MQPKEPFIVEPHPSWSKQEKWVWNRICAGEIADFNKAEGYGGELDPKNPEEWSESRILTPEFLKTILLRKPYRRALTYHGVRVIGAWFSEILDMSNASLAHDLWLDSSRFDSNVELSFLKTTHLISFENSTFAEVNLICAKIEGELNTIGSKFNGKLNMTCLQVDGNLLMSNGAEFVEVDLLNVKIRGNLNMNSSKFNGKMNMDSLEVGSHIFMGDGAEFKEVDLVGAKIEGSVSMKGSKFYGKLNTNNMWVNKSVFMDDRAEFDEVILVGAKIGEQLSMIGSKFNGKPNLDSLQIESHLLIRDGSEFREVDLRSAKIGGQLSIISSKFKGKMNMNNMQVKSQLLIRDGVEFSDVDLSGATIGCIDMRETNFSGMLDMDSIQVGSHLLMRNSNVEEQLKLIFAKIGGGLDISGSILSSLDLTNTRINNELCLGSSVYIPTKWENGSKLILRNTEVGALQDLPDAWPDELELVGFTYTRLGDFGVGESYSIAKRDISWMKEWLEKQASYSPQPYEQLGNILREAGYKNKAIDILFEGKKRERREASTWLTWFNLTLQHIFVGYGYRFRFTFFWVIALTLIGAIVLWATGQGLANGMPYGLSYSLDKLLPIIRLNESHYIIKLAGFAKYYFYIHIILGYVLASFLIAGLSGITKR